jgi:hypothetical protein
VASATGELILRKFVMSSGAPASGQGRNLNKVLTASVKNDRGMVNAPPPGKDVSFCTPGSAGWPSAWLTGVGRQAVLTRQSVCANNLRVSFE